MAVTVEDGIEGDDGLEAELAEDLEGALEVLLDEAGLLEREQGVELVGDELVAGVEEDGLELVAVADDALEVGEDFDHGRLLEVGHEQAGKLAHHVVDLVGDVFLDAGHEVDVVVADAEALGERRDLDALGVLAELDERVRDGRKLEDLGEALQVLQDRGQLRAVRRRDDVVVRAGPCAAAAACRQPEAAVHRRHLRLPPDHRVELHQLLRQQHQAVEVLERLVEHRVGVQHERQVRRRRRVQSAKDLLVQQHRLVRQLCYLLRYPDAAAAAALDAPRQRRRRVEQRLHVVCVEQLRQVLQRCVLPRRLRQQLLRPRWQVHAERVQK